MEETAGYEERFSLGLEDVASYRDFFSAEEWDSLEFGEWDHPKTNLPEGDALRLALALDDYELVTVTDIGGSNGTGFWIGINDRRFDIDYEICSHADYWDFISYFAAGQMWPVKRWPSVGPRSSAATSGHEETEIKSEEESSTAAKKHKVSVTVVEDGYELECSACDFNDHVSDRTEADNLKRLHEAFVATLVDRYQVA